MQIFIAIITSLITGGLALIGVIHTNKTSEKNIKNTMSADLKLAQAVTDTKIEELTREVREHNNFARKIPVIEEKIANLERRIS